MPRISKPSERKNSGAFKKALSRTAMFTLEVFEQILHDAEVFYVATSCQPIYNPVGFAAAKRIVAAREWQELRRRFQYARRLKLIERRKEGGRLVDILTEKGRRTHLKLRLKAVPRRADGTMTLVSYDIPEDARAGRDAFRNLLRSSGFRMAHRSFWIADKDVVAILRDWVRRKRLGKWVDVRLEKP